MRKPSSYMFITTVFSFLIFGLFGHVAQASDPIAVKREQIMLRNGILLQKKMIMDAQNKKQNIKQVKNHAPQPNSNQVQKKEIKPIRLAQRPPIQSNVSIAQTRPQDKKVDISAFAIKPMQAWREELKVPSTSNDGIEVIPHAVN